jgi:hypothetical protein
MNRMMPATRHFLQISSIGGCFTVSPQRNTVRQLVTIV